MQMNFVSQQEVTRQIGESGCELIAIVDVDYCGGGIENCAYLLRKPPDEYEQHEDGRMSERDEADQ